MFWRTGRALPLVIAAGACGLAVLTLLTIGRLYGVRIIAAAGVAAVIWVGASPSTRCCSQAPL